MGQIFAYESACGVHGQCTLFRGWLTRFLRAVTEHELWLGPELRARLGEGAEASLASIATTAEVGRTLRLRLRSGSSLDALEAALASLLPDANDWIAGQNRFYGRI